MNPTKTFFVRPRGLLSAAEGAGHAIVQFFLVALVELGE